MTRVTTTRGVVRVVVEVRRKTLIHLDPRGAVHGRAVITELHFRDAERQLVAIIDGERQIKAEFLAVFGLHEQGLVRDEHGELPVTAMTP